MYKQLTKIIVLLTTFLFVASPAFAAKPEGVGNGKEKNKTHKAEKSKSVTTANSNFSRAESDIIREYYGDHYGYSNKQYKSLPKGLQKKLARGGSLPPGWQRKLQSGEVLDNDLRALSERLPDDLLRRLPTRNQAYEVIRIKDQIVRVVKGEGTVVDILDLTDLFLRR